MNVTLFSRNAMLVLLLSCPIAKAGYDISSLLSVDSVKHLLTAGAAGYAAQKACGVANPAKVTGGYVTADNVQHVATNTTYSVSQDNKLFDRKAWAAHGASAVATEAVLNTSIGSEIIENAPVLGDFFRRNHALASFLVYLGVDALVAPEVSKLLSDRP